MAVKQHVDESDHVPSKSEQSSPPRTMTIHKIFDLFQQFENDELTQGLNALMFSRIMVSYLGRSHLCDF